MTDTRISQVGAHTFHTYPEDAASEEEAEKIAARLALVNLAKESSPEVTTVDKKLVKERILNIVTKHQSGVFMHLLPEYYCEQYKEALPHNWQRIIEECVDINQEKGVGDSMILCRASPTAKVIFYDTRVHFRVFLIGIQLFYISLL